MSFQSTLLQEERLRTVPGCFLIALLSIHAPTRGATSIFILLLTTQFFQSTLLQEERRWHMVPLEQQAPFNPRSYKRSDLCKHGIYFIIILSIHAPTRGATSRSLSSISTFDFQSTLLQEERRCYCKCGRNCKRLSIHAPTRGATSL